MCAAKRGAFIVFEGCDRSGKSTQSRLLVEHLRKRNIPVKHFQFPARDTQIGQLINSYLKNEQELNDEAIHLLFSTNRWECKQNLLTGLNKGITFIVDRYSYSGVAYGLAKGLNYDWCYSPERGLVKPDVVFYLKAENDTFSARGDYGAERYEKSDFQLKVAQAFEKIYVQESKYWHKLNAAMPVDILHKEICSQTEHVLSHISTQPLEMLT